jgi:uncharacterized iron-regulated membrane protein
VDLTAELESYVSRPPRRIVTVDARDGKVVRVLQGGAAQSAGQTARVWFRFVHTGEQYGVVGQTVAGIASLAACLLVYTGLALAWRRLIRPLFRRRAPA